MGKHDPLQPAGMRLHIQWASLPLYSVSHDITRAKEVQSAKKKQPTGNKASEARRVGRTLQLRSNIAQSFHWKLDSSGLTSSWGEIKGKLRSRACIYFLSFPSFHRFRTEWLVHLNTTFVRVTVQFVNRVTICCDPAPADQHILPRGLSLLVAGTFRNAHAMQFWWKRKHLGRKLTLAALEQPCDCWGCVAAHIRRSWQTC